MTFADNKEISARQIYRLFSFCYVGLGSLILPGRLADKTGAWGWIPILAGGAAAALYLYLINIIVRKAHGDVMRILKAKENALAGRMIGALLCMHCVLTAVYCLEIFTNVMSENLVKGENELVIMLVILAVAVYAIAGGLESWARIYEVLFLLVFIPLIFMLIMGAGNGEAVYLIPQGFPSLMKFAEAGHEVFAYFSLSFWVLFLPAKSAEETSERSTNALSAGGEKKISAGIAGSGKSLPVGKAVAGAFISALVVFVFVYEVVLGNFGPKALTKISYPVITLMSMVRIPGSFVKRLDALMLGVWFFSIFAMLTLQLFFGIKMLRLLCEKRGEDKGRGEHEGKGEGKRDGKGACNGKRENDGSIRKDGADGRKKRYVIIMTVLTVLAALIGRQASKFEAVYEGYMKTVGMGMMILIPVILSVMVRKRSRKHHRGMLLFVIFLSLGGLSGCGARELEDRCFPMLALVDGAGESKQVKFCYTFPRPRRTEDQGDDTREVDTSYSKGEGFVRAWQDYEDRLDKKTDDSHLKVVVLGRNFMEDQEAVDKMLSFMQEKQSFPRNAYVCVMEDPGQLLKIQGDLSDDAGSYLEAYIKNNNKEKEYGCVTLGMLMDEKENRMRKLYLPYIRISDGNIIWESFYLVDKGKAAGCKKNE